jgi:hypothetical protein
LYILPSSRGVVEPSGLSSATPSRSVPRCHMRRPAILSRGKEGGRRPSRRFREALSGCLRLTLVPRATTKAQVLWVCQRSNLKGQISSSPGFGIGPHLREAPRVVGYLGNALGKCFLEFCAGDCLRSSDLIDFGVLHTKRWNANRSSLCPAKGSNLANTRKKIT